MLGDYERRVALLVSLQAHLNERASRFDPAQTNAYRLLHGATDGFPGLYIDRYGDYLLAQISAETSPGHEEILEKCRQYMHARGVYWLRLDRHIREAAPHTARPQLLTGTPTPSKFPVRENHLEFEIDFHHSYSVGLFLDQRENRRRVASGHIDHALHWHSEAPGAPAEVLNCFAYTCGFSVAAARAGHRTTSLDLSKNYLEWGKRNFQRNGLNPELHAFIRGDTFDWLRRLRKQERSYRLVILDPPTFSKSKLTGLFRAVRHYDKLVAAAVPLVARGGFLLACCNTRKYPARAFQNDVHRAVLQTNRRVNQAFHSPPPFDFAPSRNEPPYLKAIWLELT